MRIICISLIALALNSILISQTENNFAPNDYGTPKYFYDYLNFSSDQEGKTRLDVFIQVPYSNIQFVKNDEGFTAKYSITVSVFDEDRENLMVEKSWIETVTTKDFAQTNADGNFNLSLKSFTLTPGDYVIRSEVDDQESDKNYNIEHPFTVRSLKDPVSVSDVIIIARQTEVNGNTKIIPNVSQNVAKQEEGIPIFFEIYSAAPLDAEIKYEIQDAEKDEVFSKEETKHLDAGKTQVFFTIKDVEFSIGSYLLNISVSSNDDLLTGVSKRFYSRWQGVPSSVKDLDEAISQMMYIATTDEMDLLEDAETREEKLNRYLEYWKKKDPTPNTEENELFNEYYRRIEFANESFSHYVDGWKTDRGMVYIILGAPNNVDRHPFEYDSKPYEVWQYYRINRSLVFLDETGFGDYRLITPLVGDEFRFRYE